VLQAAVTNAVARGVTVVAAGGNSGQGGGAWSYPGAYPNVVAVAAIDITDTVAAFSTKGSYIDVAAPGVSILSTYKGTYKSLSGTSMAAPHVSAGAALIVQRFPGWSPSAVQDCLESTASHLGAPGKNTATGAGRIDPITAATCT
jgi:subtilisin family serine protease